MSKRRNPLGDAEDLSGGLNTMDKEQNGTSYDQDASILSFDVDDTAIELAATGVGTIPTASVNMVPPNCCVQQKR
jgi:hypothetical protein